MGLPPSKPTRFRSGTLVLTSKIGTNVGLFVDRRGNVKQSKDEKILNELGERGHLTADAMDRIKVDFESGDTNRWDASAR